MSKREEMRRRRQQRARRQQLTILGVIGLAALIVTGILIWPSLRPVGAIVTVPTQVYALADGKALGSADAPVLIQEFSDFQ